MYLPILRVHERKRSAKDFSNDAFAMFLFVFIIIIIIIILIFFRKAYVVCFSFQLHRQVDALSMHFK